MFKQRPIASYSAFRTLIVDYCSNWDTSPELRGELRRFLDAIPDTIFKEMAKNASGRFFRRQQVWVISPDHLGREILLLRHFLKDEGYTLPELFRSGTHAIQSVFSQFEAVGASLPDQLKRSTAFKAIFASSRNHAKCKLSLGGNL